MPPPKGPLRRPPHSKGVYRNITLQRSTAGEGHPSNQTLRHTTPDSPMPPDQRLEPCQLRILKNNKAKGSRWTRGGGVLKVGCATVTWEPGGRLPCGPGRAHHLNSNCGFIKRREMGLFWRSGCWVWESPPGLTLPSLSFPP